jgi:hypothetical protein
LKILQDVVEYRVFDYLNGFLIANILHPKDQKIITMMSNKIFLNLKLKAAGKNGSISISINFTGIQTKIA